MGVIMVRILSFLIVISSLGLTNSFAVNTQLAAVANNQQAVEEVLLKSPDTVNVFSLLQIAYALQNQDVIDALEKFITQNSPETKLFKLISNQQISYRQQEQRAQVRALEYSQNYEKFRAFCKAKKMLKEDATRFLKIINLEDVTQLNQDWKKNFTPAEVTFLSTVISDDNLFWLLNLLTGDEFEEMEDLGIFLGHLITIDINIHKELKDFLQSDSKGILQGIGQFKDHELCHLRSMPASLLMLIFKFALAKNNTELCKQLLIKENSWMVNVKNRNGKTVLELAIDLRNLDMVKIVLECNPDFNPDNILHSAVHSGNFAFVQIVNAYLTSNQN